MRHAQVLFVLIPILILASCGDDSSTPPPIPSGCQSQGVFAINVLEAALDCLPTNAYTDASQALGAPDGSVLGPGKTELGGMVSLGVQGSLTLFMGSCIQDLDGPDLRVYQIVADEFLEVQVSQNQDGPFVSLGSQHCGDATGGFPRKCDFDLAGSGLNNVRVVKIIDREQTSFPAASCDSDGLSPGADIDAVEVLHPGS
jgi:hypothetical protein